MSNKSKSNMKKKINKLVDQFKPSKPPKDLMDRVDYSNKTYMNLKKYFEIQKKQTLLENQIKDFSKLFERDLFMDFYSDEMIEITKLKLFSSIFKLGLKPKFTHELDESEKIEITKKRIEFIQNPSKCIEENSLIKIGEVV